MLRVRNVISLTKNISLAAFYSDTAKPEDTGAIYLDIPPYPVEKPQSLEIRKSRLMYQSRKRGMLENDLLLSTFAKKYLDTFNEEQTMMYDRLINSPTNDWDIFYWMVGKKPTPEEFDNEIMNLLKKHAENEGKVPRRVPDL